MRLAVKEIVVHGNPRHFQPLESMVGKLDCEDCQSVKEKSDCLRLAGKAYAAIKDLNSAAENLYKAVTLTPSNANLRMELIMTLRESGDRQTALQQARLGRQISPVDQRFHNVIKQMAISDLEQNYNLQPIK